MSDKRSMLFLVLAGLLWGTGGLTGALLQSTTGLHPIAVAAYRLLIGGGLATLVLAGQLAGVPRTTAAVRRLLAVGALLGLFQAGYFGAVMLTSVSLATLLTIGSAPVIVAIITAVRERRMPRAQLLGSIGLSLGGLALLASTPGSGGLWQTVVGALLALGTGAGFAVLTVLTRRPVPGLNSGITTALGLLIGGVMLLPLAVPLGMAVPVTGEVLLLVAFLGVVPTAVAYGAYFVGLRGAPAITAALASILEPLTATVLSVLVLDDRLGVAGTVGAGLLAVALVLNYSARPVAVPA